MARLLGAAAAVLLGVAAAVGVVTSIARGRRARPGASPGGRRRVRLLLALLAARDGRFDEALRRYGEVAPDDPSDPLPHAIAYLLCGIAGRPEEEAARWEPSGRLLDLGADDHALRALLEELVVAAALGGAPYAILEDESEPMPALVVQLCAALAAALRGKETPVVEKLRLRAARAFLHARIVFLRARMLSAVKAMGGVGLAESTRRQARCFQWRDVQLCSGQ